MYCVKCKKQTETKDSYEALSKNNRKMMKGICIICNSKKATFLKSSQGKGIVSNVVKKVPLIGKFLSPLFEKIGLGINKTENGCRCSTNTDDITSIIAKILLYMQKYGEHSIDEEYKGTGLYLTPHSGYGLYLGPHKGGILPIIPILAAIIGGLGGVGGLAGGISSAVNAGRQTEEQKRHHKVIEEQMKGSGIFLGKRR